RRRVGVDAKRLRPLPRLSPARRRARRIQRQVHEQPARAAGRKLRHAAGAPPPDLPQLLPARGSLGLHGAPVMPRFRDALTTATLVPDLDPAEILSGLGEPQKRLPSRYFYDAAGSRLFEDITRLPEYYPTRTEISILAARAADIARLAGPGPG